MNDYVAAIEFKILVSSPGALGQQKSHHWLLERNFLSLKLHVMVMF